MVPECLVITFDKYDSSQKQAHQQSPYVVWGPYDFLTIDRIDSLSNYQVHMRTSKKGETVGITKRSMFIYKDDETKATSGHAIDWIFDTVHVDRYPLFVITLITANSCHEVCQFVMDEKRSPEYIYDVFKILSNETGVVIYRGKTYESIIRAIIHLNSICQNTYSISGIQIANPEILSGSRGKNQPQALVLPNHWGEINNGQVLVSVDCRVRDRNQATGSLSDVVCAIQIAKENFLTDFKLTDHELNVEAYYELGNFDLNLLLRGKMAFVVEFLLNPTYGLVNFQSSFYTKYMIESRTTWKCLAPDSL